MAIQRALGADVAMAFDQCPPYPASEAAVAEACRRTHRWLERCVACHGGGDQALFGIVQGCFPHLREASARVVAAMDLPGIAVGGVSVGEPVEEMQRVVRQVGPLLPEQCPHYLMGVGSLREMAIAVANGFDLFDCVLPTRLGRHGTALVGGSAGTCATPASATTTPPSIPAVAAWPADSTAAATCTTCSAARNCWDAPC